MHLERNTTMLLIIGMFALCFIQGPVAFAACTAAANTANMNASFLNVRPNSTNDPNDTFAYRDYVCTGFQPNAPVAAEITSGTFDVSTVNTRGHETGAGAGWVIFYLQIRSSPNAQIAQYEQCYGAAPTSSAGGPTCYATADVRAFSIPQRGNWQKRGTTSAEGFADGTGKAVVRVYVSRVEQTRSAEQGAENHLVTTTDGKITFTALPQ